MPIQRYGPAAEESIASYRMGGMRRPWHGAGASVLLLAGCGAAGPEVRLAPDPAEWVPARVLVLPATLAGGAVSTGKALPAGLTAPTQEAAAAAVRTSLIASLAGCATRCTVEPAPEFTRSDTADAAAKIARQYQDSRQTDPEAGKLAAAEWGGTTPETSPGVLLITVLKYGPEVDEDVSSMSKSVSTTVGTTDVGISSSAQRIVAYLNVQLRCALVRGYDGMLVWDASARRRVKSAAAGDAGLDGLLAQAVADLCQGWPWHPRAADAEPEKEQDEPDDAPVPAKPAVIPAPAAVPAAASSTPLQPSAPASATPVR